MRRLSRRQRERIITLLVEGVSLRSASRITGHTLDTCMRLLADAGEACMQYHDRAVRGVRARRVETDEIWSFTYCKQGTLAAGRARKPPPGAGDTWTWTALDPDSKLLISWLVAPQSYRAAVRFMQDLQGRLAQRFQLTTDGRPHYLSAVRDVFGEDIDYAQLVKQYGPSGDDPERERRYSAARVSSIDPRQVTGNPDPKLISTANVGRLNKTLRESIRRFTRLTGGFSKKLENFVHHIALYAVFYNFCRVHGTLRVTPAMEAGLADSIRDISWIVELVEENTPAPGPRGPYRRRERPPLVARERGAGYRAAA